MKKSILKLGKTLAKPEQKQINGGGNCNYLCGVPYNPRNTAEKHARILCGCAGNGSGADGLD
ncbi:hypothetical protein [Tenacibaculum sp. 190524A02b]|uniref:hypothetical protein n=1 Tax=Tenacibaculum vairaonense TaxID=3137860 RepID=UPI0031FB67B7